MRTKDILLETVAVSRRWSSLPKRTMTDQLTSVDKRVRLPLGTVLVLGTALAACARISSELPNTTNPVVDNGPRSGEVTPIYDGLSYNKNVGVLGVGIDSFDPIPQTQKLSELALVALKFPQGEPNSQVLVSETLSKVLPGLDEAMVARDKDGVEKSGLLSINNNLFVLTRVGEGPNNSLAIFAPNYASIKHNVDGSASMNAYMTTRDGQGKWRIEQNIMISITLVFDANGKLISYIVPVLNLTFEPTREPDQRADVIVPKNISFRAVELKAPEPTSTIPATSTSMPTVVPTWTPAPTYTQARPLPTAVVGPSAIPKPDVQNGVVATLEAYGDAKIFVSYNPLNYNLPSGNKGSWVLVDCRNRPIENWVGCPNVNVGIQYRTSAEALAALNSMFPGQVKETAYGYYQRSDVGFPTTGFLYWSK